VCRRLADLITAEQTQTLRAFVAQMDEAIERCDSAAYYQLNVRFHDAMVAFARHGRAKQTYDALIKETHLLRQSSLIAPARMRESNSEHAGIVAAIVAGDGEMARLLAEAHALGGKRRWLEARNE
jgi:DNA-binding GntR family transcriptional regulator